LELNNDVKDIIGYLRGVILITIFWKSRPLHFPMDPFIEWSLGQCSPEFQELLDIACSISVTETIYDEMRSAIDDILDESRGDYYDQETVGLFLSLWAGDRVHRAFTYDEPARFIDETGPILDRMLLGFTESLFWVRAAYYERNPDAALPDPLPSLRRFLTILLSLAPTDSKLPAMPDLLTICIVGWTNADAVRKGMGLEPNGKSGLGRVVEELLA
jgi:hypothetical protein